MNKCNKCNRVKKTHSYSNTLRVTDADGIKKPRRICDRCRKGLPPKD